jgi:hypothetical protein
VPVSGAVSTCLGHAVADIVRGGVRYKAAGGFSLQFHFKNPSGFDTYQISNIDGATVSGGVTAPMNNPAIFSGGLTADFGSGVTLPGSTGGAFFKSPADSVAEVGSQFSYSGTVGGQPYSAVGVTQGKR